MEDSTTYQVGDRVRIKSLDRYNQNKNKSGQVDCGYAYFSGAMSNLCGNVVTIKKINKEGSYYIKEGNWCVTDSMIECKVSEETPAEESVPALLSDMKAEFDGFMKSAESLITRLKQAQQALDEQDKPQETKALEIKPQFNVSDKVWIMNDNRPQEFKIEEINIKVLRVITDRTEMPRFGMKPFVTYKTEVRPQISYKLTGRNNGNSYTFEVPEGLCFASKEALLENFLKSNSK